MPLINKAVYMGNRLNLQCPWVISRVLEGGSGKILKRLLTIDRNAQSMRQAEEKKCNDKNCNTLIGSAAQQQLH